MEDTEIDERLEYRLENEKPGEIANFRSFLIDLAEEFFGGREACSNLSILNVACGYMRVAPVLVELFAKPVCAVDENSRRIKALTARTGRGEVAATIGDAADLDRVYEGREFDVVLLRHPDILAGGCEEMYEQCEKVLKDGGILITTFHMIEEEAGARPILEKLGLTIRKSGQNRYGTWAYGIEGFMGEDGYFIVAQKSVGIVKALFSIRRDLYLPWNMICTK
jgi:SAM-dependent methyltransferase